jgi:type I restriction-modification system DNA methylase subunit
VIPEAILKIVERFEFHRPAYLRDQYGELQLRKEFIDPFFKALGWDVDNTHNYSPANREVIHEYPIQIRGVTGHVDYAFRIAGGPIRFVVEVKKPSVRIKDDANAALQLRRYAWNANLPLNILTNFDEFAIYDCTIPPKHNDSAGMGRIEYFTFKEYPQVWETISSRFTQEAILRGSLERVAKESGKKGTTRVDDVFLFEIEKWRELLAKNLHLRNPSLSEIELNLSVQKIIDRIIFLRICEDRRIEKYETLKSLLDTDNTYAQLCEFFKNADTKYNSGLFHFKDEKGWYEPPDQLTTTLNIDDKIIKTIIQDIYFPSPYEFSVIPPAILGHVYEQFLGKVISLRGTRVNVEDKPAVKKAGGVYYTPEFIVQNIVKNTVGGLVKGKTPCEVSNLHIVDPACGSGSFLLGAYQFLLNWHLDWYIQNLVPVFKEKGSVNDPAVQALLPELPDYIKEHTDLPIRKSEIEQAGRFLDRVRSDWKLTTLEKKRILTNNIYGVDLDQQAVEVTKLSLLLKVLEEDTAENILQRLHATAERALPTLHQNIKCGNSLVGMDIYADIQQTIDQQDTMRINAFDWNREFPDIMHMGGFDVVIGNPPYIRIQTMKEWAPKEVEYYKKMYFAASKGNYDIYVVFVEKGIALLNKTGILGYILPHKFFNAQYGEPLRSIIADKKSLYKIVHFGDQQVFSGATTYTALLFLSKESQKDFDFYQVNNLDEWQTSESAIHEVIPEDKVTKDDWNFVVGESSQLFNKLNNITTRLGDITTNIFQGIVTSADPVYILKVKEKMDKGYLVYSKFLKKDVNIEDTIVKPFLKDDTIEPYREITCDYVIIFPYDESGLIKWERIKQAAPLTAQYLTECKSFLANREKGKMNHSEWYAYVYPKNLFLFQKPKLIVQVISKTGRYTFDSSGAYFTGGGNGPYYGLLVAEGIDIYYILGLLNSKLLDFYLHKVSSPFRGSYWSYGKRFIEQLPTRMINPSDPVDVNRYNRMIALVTQMVNSKKLIKYSKLEHEKIVLQRQTEEIERQINDLTYELYNLTSEEIALIEPK